MEPAYPLVLTSEEHALLGELVEIMGQIDDILLGTVTRLLNIDRPAAAKIMGSSRVADSVEIWLHAIEIASMILKSRNGSTLQKPLIVTDLMKARNDFIHALFVPDYVEAGYFEPGVQTVTATRTRSDSKRPVSDLQSARDLAVSCLVAHIDGLALPPRDRAP